MLLGASAPAASADRPFTQRFGQVERGDVTFAANTVMTCPSSAGSSCTNGRNGTGGSLNNLDFSMVNVDVDGDGTTFNSSSADLTVPAGATVLFAGLYWGADTQAGGGGGATNAPNPALNNVVRLRVPGGGSYSDVTASQLDTDAANVSRYQGFADVTSQVTAAGSGTYTIANVQAGTGTDRYGGWSLVLAYRTAALPWKWVSVYDGFLSVGVGGTHGQTDITIGGFQAPVAGTVSADLGLYGYEGELGYTGEAQLLNGVAMSDATHPANNIWNAAISRLGTTVTAKNPNYVNQFGFDANVIDVDGRIANAATTATLRLQSPLDLYLPGALSLVTDTQVAPPVNTVLPGVSGTAQVGQTLTATPGTWTGNGPIDYTYEWQRCDASGASCVDIPGATGPTYVPTADDVGHTLRAEVVATNPIGTSTATSDPTTVVNDPSGGSGSGSGSGSDSGSGSGSDSGSGSGSDSGSGSGSDSGSGSGSGSGEGADDLSSIDGNQIDEDNCMRIVAGTGVKRKKLAGFGTIKVLLRATAYVKVDNPLRLSTSASRGRLKAVRYALDGRTLAQIKKKPYWHDVKPSALSARSGDTHSVRVTLIPVRGKAATFDFEIKTRPCENLLSTAQWRTAKGAGLRLRVDSRRALGPVTFKAPSTMLPKSRDAGRGIGRVRVFLAGGIRKPYTLSMTKAKGNVLLEGPGKPKVQLTRTGAIVSNLAEGTGIVELTLYTQKATSPRAILRHGKRVTLSAMTTSGGESIRLNSVLVGRVR